MTQPIEEKVELLPCANCGHANYGSLSGFVPGIGDHCSIVTCHCTKYTRPAPADVVADGANVFKRYFALLDKFEEDERLAPLFSATGRDICVEFAQAETATITAERDRLKEALASLLEASRQYELFGLRYGIDFGTQVSADTYKRLSNRLGDAQAKAQALLSEE